MTFTQPLIVPLKTLLTLELRLSDLRLHLYVDAGGSSLRDPDRPKLHIRLHPTVRYSEQADSPKLAPFLGLWMDEVINPLEAILQVDRITLLLRRVLLQADYWRDAVLQTFIDEGISLDKNALADSPEGPSRRIWRSVIQDDAHGLHLSPLSLNGACISSLEPDLGAWNDYGFPA